MIRGAQRWTACISLGGYLLALAGAALFHVHSHNEVVPAGSVVTEGEASREPARCSHGHGHRDAPARPDCSPRSAPPSHGHEHHGHEHHGHEHHGHEHHGHGTPHHHTPHHHDDCGVCQFLALKQLPAAAPAIVAGSQPVAEQAEAALPTLALSLPWRPLSRAPPA